jgi:hypothetical protein
MCGSLRAAQGGGTPAPPTPPPPPTTTTAANGVTQTTTSATTVTTTQSASTDAPCTYQVDDYRGAKAVTVSGLACQAWGAQTPHAHSRTPANYPGTGIDGAANNFCRDPDGEGYLWCYTISSGTRYEECVLTEDECLDIPECWGRYPLFGPHVGRRSQTSTQRCGLRSRNCTNMWVEVPRFAQREESTTRNGHTKLGSARQRQSLRAVSDGWCAPG